MTFIVSVALVPDMIGTFDGRDVELMLRNTAER